ncbi:MAG: eCIS core domain-containing protein [Gemmatimonadales bacterium]
MADTGIEHATGGGRPLSVSERQFFEPRFGQDFGHVRIHADARAADSARSVNALAYTIGSHITFGEGQYQPGTTKGRTLLAHELTHTVQQRAASGPSLQRTIGDGHDLTSPRFSGDLVLEAVYDGERLLRADPGGGVGSRGPAVAKIQKALVDAGFSLPRFGVDGKFGPETKAAVSDLQHASGLTGAALDGIVGPTTMGWLDQRFSAGPTPAGTTPSATTGCGTIKSVNIDMVSLDGSTRNPIVDLERANTIFNQCCVRFTLGGGGSEGAARTTALLGGDTDLAQSPTCGTATAEETALFSGATADFGLSSRVRAFLVASVNSGAPSYSVPPFCATGAAAGLRDMAVVANSASVRGLAHELGHVLLNSGVHPADPLNLMSPVATPPGEQLTAPQCATIFANA